MVINQKTSTEGQALLIQFSEPWMFVQRIVSCKIDVVTETEELFYYKEFRWSIDGFSFTDFMFAGDNFENLIALKVPNDKPFFLQIRLTQVGDGELLVNSIDINLIRNDNEFCLNTQLTCCDANSVAQGLVFNNCCGESFNPYGLGNTQMIYQQLCGVISNMFGFCVGYYRVDPDQKSRDVILKEYSLYNVAQYDTVKIVIPDNTLPSRDIQYNPLMLDFPAQFEVHIVRSSFEQVFGAGARPQQHDYLYFEQYMNRMYEVDAVTQPDDVIFGSAYWRVSLVPYQKRTAVGYDGTEDLKVQTDDIVTSIEDVFKEEREVEYEDTRKPNQYNNIGTLSDDYVRSYIHKLLKIEQEQVHHGYTVIAKYCYDLTTIPVNEIAVKYRKGIAFQKSQYGYVNGAISFFLNLQTKPVQKTILKFAETNEDRTVLIANYPKIDKIERLKYDSLVPYDFLKIDRKLYCITSVNIENDKVYVGLGEPLDAAMKDFVAIKQTHKNDLLVYNDNFKIQQSGKNISIVYNGKEYIPDYTFEINKWHQFVINYNEMSNQLSLFVYAENNNKIEKVYKDAEHKKDWVKYTWSNVEIKEDTEGEWILYGNESKFTNFRVWKAPIEEDVQMSILQQYVVNDTHLTTLVDNATPELLLQKTK